MMTSKIKDHWVLADSDSVTVKHSKKSAYPVNLIVHGHPIIEKMEISDTNYIKIKMYGKWIKLYLPSEKAIERAAEEEAL